MKKSTKRYSPFSVALIGGIIATGATFSALCPAWSRPASDSLKDSPKLIVDQVWQLVNREYVDSTFNQQDWQAVRQRLLSKNYSSKEEAYAAISNALEILKDPYTRFMDPKQYESLTRQTSGEVSGIGIRMQIHERTQRLTVVEALENSPALQAGIKAGDEILAIDGKPTQLMQIEEASRLIRGKVGTVVTLRMGRRGQTAFNVKLKRATIEVPTVRYTLKQEGNRRIGYISLREFSGHAAEQMQRAIKNLNSKQVDGFVLDLRGNPGGLLQASIEIARMWMDKGAIVRTTDRRGGNELTHANNTALTQRPLVVLVDQNSASASEILTGALKDNKRAIVVGSQTFGKALVQAVHQLTDGSGVAITIAHYYTPKGTDINRKGIKPDIQIDLTKAQERQLATNPKLLATKNDPQYARALAVLSNNLLAQPLQTQPSQSASFPSTRTKKF
ncbi:MAG: S41 family peptidase [Nostocaceae cyanobacterium]|nr:S41 family peptidase [Nostocaceae cyanobacterium]